LKRLGNMPSQGEKNLVPADSQETPVPAPAPVPTPAHSVVSVMISPPPKEKVDGRFKVIAFFFVNYILAISFGIDGCKNETNEVCIMNHCFRACSMWWLVIIGAIGLFRSFVLSFGIVWTKYFYDENVYHSSCLFFSNHLIRYFETFLFSTEVVLVIFIGLSINEHNEEFPTWISTFGVIMAQVIWRFVNIVRDLVKRDRDIVKRDREHFGFSNV